uniref:sushi, von Willebrand factor type A, EGF and pentraxin domain-containing protein 1-like isoform X2 n=1 Tax=Myxine glutinosa TaxID=7769 RepID=UPI00358E4E79
MIHIVQLNLPWNSIGFFTITLFSLIPTLSGRPHWPDLQDLSDRADRRFSKVEDPPGNTESRQQRVRPMRESTADVSEYQRLSSNVSLKNHQQESRESSGWIGLAQLSGGADFRSNRSKVPCLPPDSMMFGVMETNELDLGGIISFRCDEGYTLIGQRIVQCFSNGSWNSHFPSCEPVSCGLPEDITNGFFIESGITYKSTATYVCTSGYRLRGPNVRNCQGSGRWNGNDPTCEVISCGSPPRLRNSIIKGDTFTHGSVITYVCNDGYKMTGTLSTRECLSVGVWSHNSAICSPVSCGSPPRVEKAVVRGQSYLFGKIVHYICSEGYKLEGQGIICTSYGKWASVSGDELPHCAAQFCSDFPVIQFGILNNTLSRNLSVGTKATFRCQRGYKLQGNGAITCQSGGHWFSSPAIPCVPVQCGEPAAITHGYISGSDHTFESVVAYSCFKGFYIKGEKKRSCQTSGRWSGKLPSCHPVSCGDPAEIANGQVEIPNGTVYKSKISYSCDQGYQLQGSQNSTCEANRQWSTVSPASCLRANCSPPQTLKHGLIRLVNTSRDFGLHLIQSNISFWNLLYSRPESEALPPGSILKFTCNKGFELVGTSTWTCTSEGRWSSPSIPVCEPIRCPPLQALSEGVASGSSYIYGSSVIFSCHKGYRLIGSPALQCSSSGQWNSTMPTCQPVSCNAPPQLRFGSLMGSDFSVGSNITFSCMRGFYMHGEPRLLCLPSGLWDTKFPECLPLECPHPETIPNGIVDIQGLTYLSTAVYTCKPGHKMVGEPSVQCDDNGKWLGSAPVCNPVQCPAVPEVKNGKLVGDARHFGDVVTFSCDRGYRLQGKNKITCQPSGQWTSTSPVCGTVMCGAPDPIDNGFVEGSDYTFGSLIIYSCFPGYRLLGNGLQTCEETGWSDREPRCIPEDCGLPPHIDFGNYIKLNYQKNHRVSSTGNIWPRDQAAHSLAYVMKSLAEFLAMPQLISMLDKDSSPKPNLNEPKTSLRERSNDQGTANRHARSIHQDLSLQQEVELPMSEFLHGTFIQYSCMAGYEMVGSSVLTCREDGTWNGSAPLCRPRQCESPQPPEHGIVKFSSHTFGAIATYSCKVGYTLIGPVMRFCTSDSEWDTTAPLCKRLSCDIPHHIFHGIVHGDDFSFDSVVTYDCNPGYTLIGQQKRTCSANGTWSQEEPTCIPQDCGFPPSLTNGQIIGRDYTFLGKITYNCNLGFVIQGEFVVTCLQNGRWSGGAPKCLPIHCPQPNNIENGRVEGSVFAFSHAVHYYCMDGYLLSGPRVRKCQSNGVWSGRPPKCEPISCGPPADIVHGFLIGSSFLFRDKVEYVCFSGYNLFGGPIRNCLSNGSWSGDVPSCQALECNKLPMLKNGMKDGESASYGSVVIFKCQEGFELKGPALIECGMNGRWSADFPSCVPVSCGPPLAAANSSVSIGSFFLGDQIIYTCHPGFIMNGHAKLTCTATGKWQPLFPQCHPIRCGVPPPIPNTVMTGGAFTFNSRVYYRCLEGYTLNKGVAWRTCLKSGTWSEASTYCTPMTCSSPPILPFASLVGNNFTVNQTVHYVCDEGFGPKWSRTFACKPNGKWLPSLEEVSCKPADCGKPNTIRYGRLHGNRFTYNSTVSYSCDHGYHLEGHQLSSCLSNGSWSEVSPQCVPISCGPPSVLTRGFITAIGYVIHDTISYHCDPGHVLDGNWNRTCLANGHWSGKKPHCRRVRCSPPPNIPNAVRRGRHHHFGDVVLYSCYSGYSLHGPSTLICLYSGSWSGKPECQAVCVLPCLNGGRCSAPYHCTCPRGWHGARCQQAICHNPCLHGGMCVAPNRCQCPTGWGGRDCSQKRKLGYYVH